MQLQRFSGCFLTLLCSSVWFLVHFYIVYKVFKVVVSTLLCGFKNCNFFACRCVVAKALLCDCKNF